MSTLRRRKDLEKTLPRSIRRNDKTRVFENTSGEIFIVVGAKHRTEAELLGIARESLAMQQAAELTDVPAVGGMQ